MISILFSVSRAARKGDPNKIYDVIIIGSGPAGLTAAIYTLRSGLSTLIITGLDWGGQLMTTTKVENFPGFPEGIDGPNLMMKMREQAIKFGAELVENNVEDIEVDSKPFKVKVGNMIYKGKSIIIATGARYRELSLESEKRLLGRGVSYCAVCDGFFYRNKPVAIIGGGEAALTDALYLSSICREVHLIHRRDKFRASDALVEQVLSTHNIYRHMNKVVIDIIGDKKVTGIKIKDVKTGMDSVLAVEAVFIAIGHIPNTEVFKDKVELTKSGYIKVYDIVKTNIPGIFAAGDVMDPKYKQAITASAFGAMAAIEAKEYLESL